MTLFLLGAGFDLDANGSVSGIPPNARYPTTEDLLRLCFELKQAPPGKSVEDLFQDAVDRRDRKPLDALYKALMTADYYLARKSPVNGSTAGGPYVDFVTKFETSHFLTFNYDSHVEILLFGLGRWRPDDGYGVPVRTQMRPRVRGPLVDRLPARSSSFVLHLHGTLCVYPVEYEFVERPGSPIQWMEERDPTFCFDPDMIGDLFFPFERVLPGLTYRRADERIIAPVPKKADDLKGSFIRAVYARANELISVADTIVCIGYRFSSFDIDSFQSLLAAARPSTKLTIIAPDAPEICARLSAYTAVPIEGLPLTFRAWAESGFPVAS